MCRIKIQILDYHFVISHLIGILKPPITVDFLQDPTDQSATSAQDKSVAFLAIYSFSLYIYFFPVSYSSETSWHF